MKQAGKERIPLAFYYYIHSRLWDYSHQGFIKKELLNSMLREFFNIEKRLGFIVIKELELLGMVEIEDSWAKIKKPSLNKEDLIADTSRKLGLLI